MSCKSGRPREFTHPKRRELLDHIGQGATVEEAARIVGVSLRTVQREAKHNEHIHHDLHLALHAAPVDPHKLMLRAARTHWRAAAWLLERTDPDRFAKRPPNSCRPETLMDVSNWLIETALEASPPEQRETVYRRMHAVADKAFEVLMPDQHDARRALVGALPERAMPLSDHEIAKTLRVVRDRPAPEWVAPVAGRPATGVAQRQEVVPENPPVPVGTQVGEDANLCHPRTHIQDFRLLDSEQMDADWRYPLPTEEEDDEDADAATPTVGGVSDASGAPAGAEPVSPSAHHNPLESGSTDRGQRPLPRDAGCPSIDPPNGGIMSPKMPSATKDVATKVAAAAAPPFLAARDVANGTAPLHAANGATRHQAGDGIADLKCA